jgi:metallo-beta-lactamase family protein
MKVTFWGAVETVTGSLHELQVDGRRYILDCGLYQGHRHDAYERNSHFPFPVTSLDSVLLSHAHIDHSGNLPNLSKNGYEGPIYTTPATVDLCRSMLRDSAYLQEKDAEFINKRYSRSKKLRRKRNNNQQVLPLYTMADAERVMPLFRSVDYHQPAQVGDNLSYEAYDAGHILGSSSLLLERRRNGRSTRLAFSGDVGRKGLPIIRDPQQLPAADYLILESTYGGRLHQPPEKVADKLADVVHRTASRGGKLIIPAFAVGRTQQIVLLLHELANAGRIPELPVFVDSPLAVDATEVYRAHPECYDEKTRAYLLNHEEPFGFGQLRYVRDVNESKALNDLHESAVIISASGMCEGGRILHHLRNNIEDQRNTVLLVG